MKPIRIALIFWSSLVMMNTLFTVLLIWSLVPIGGATLPQCIAQVWSIGFYTAAALVSLACGLLAVGSMSLKLWVPFPCSAEQS